jgi:hypothetical protein
MPALKKRPTCWAHTPELAKARSEARRRGGGANKKPPLTTPAAPVASAVVLPFELGRVETRFDVGPALLRIARAIAAGEVDARRGRLLVEAMRAAAAAFHDAAPWDAPTTGETTGWDALTDEQHRYIIEHEGRLPPGVTIDELRGAVRVVDGDN